MWIDEHHTTLAIIAGVGSTAWVIYATFQAHIALVQASLARAEQRMHVAEKISEAICDDEEEEKRSNIEKTITTEWDI